MGSIRMVAVPTGTRIQLTSKTRDSPARNGNSVVADAMGTATFNPANISKRVMKVCMDRLVLPKWRLTGKRMAL
jgi:hypothetical protein